MILRRTAGRPTPHTMTSSAPPMAFFPQEHCGDGTPTKPGLNRNNRACWASATRAGTMPDHLLRIADIWDKYPQVAPYVPALPAGAPLALEHQPTLVLTPITNEEKGQETGAHEKAVPSRRGRGAAEAAQEPIAPLPPPVPGQERGCPVITSPIPTPGDLSHTTPFPSSPVQHQAQQWRPSSPEAFPCRARQRSLPVPACPGARCHLRRSGGNPGRNGDAGA